MFSNLIENVEAKPRFLGSRVKLILKQVLIDHEPAYTPPPRGVGVGVGGILPNGNIWVL